MTLTSWSRLQNLVSSLSLSVFRQAPPGKCKYEPLPVKTKSKRVQFRPLARESVSVPASGPGIEALARCPLQARCSPPRAGGLFPRRLMLWMRTVTVALCVRLRIPESARRAARASAETRCPLSMHPFFTGHCSFSPEFAAVTVLIPGATAVNLTCRSSESNAVQANEEIDRAPRFW